MAKQKMTPCSKMLHNVYISQCETSLSQTQEPAGSGLKRLYEMVLDEVPCSHTMYYVGYEIYTRELSYLLYIP